ncbi:FAD dependent oxidoreductase [Scheffersomyces amazonensis]|uniref:FAD dependent oxidoreductase n=1 Tax=Scheffersomyces amazonensis TaxID=1078765 RepID=UPI00315C9D88
MADLYNQLDKSSPIVIVGAGTFGLSTALELLRGGFVDVTLVDPYPPPSPLSAGNDINKIFQYNVDSLFYSQLAWESYDLWKTDPVYKDSFYESGIIYAASTSEKKIDLDNRMKLLQSRGIEFRKLYNHQDFSNLIALETPENGITNELGSRFKNWYGYFQSSNCGWVNARHTLETAFHEIIKLGGKFICQEAKSLIVDNGIVTGITTSLESIYGDRVVLCAGAQSYKFLDFKNQLLAKCFTLAHIKVNSEEAAKLKSMPVILNLNEGFLFEPDENGIIKVCNEFPGYINFSQSNNTPNADNGINDSINNSIPLYVNNIPYEAEVQIRDFLKQVFPAIATRKFESCKLCWCTDTPDRHFLITTHPQLSNLILGTGDSGQGFKYMPIIGKYITSYIIGSSNSLVPPEIRNCWKWRPDQGQNRDIYCLQNRSGGSDKVRNLCEIKQWSHEKEQII